MTIICNVTVIKEPKTYTSRSSLTAKPSILCEHLGNLLSVEKGADINFDVDGQNFLAHRCVLAASSPVFAQFSALITKEVNVKSIKISDIEAPVFEAILLYNYTDAARC